ncbi:hypothetical protein PROFUN_04604 [Planoprotostelium fungivorum]|uniref:Uncharacterized protein n=1 Tax=Planoprotostelium fungivorum TaxID=1890364 RepID=A0A2P6NUC6_9EUKA|nr:hypothetical protein PROFUN_04604 [Planoprotostelium fungivorum]
METSRVESSDVSAVFCHMCGTKGLDRAVFCYSCGNKLFRSSQRPTLVDLIPEEKTFNVSNPTNSIPSIPTSELDADAEELINEWNKFVEETSDPASNSMPHVFSDKKVTAHPQQKRKRGGCSIDTGDLVMNLAALWTTITIRKTKTSRNMDKITPKEDKKTSSSKIRSPKIPQVVSEVTTVKVNPSITDSAGTQISLSAGESQRPQNEGERHYLSKEKIVRELSKRKSVDVIQFCSTKQNTSAMESLCKGKKNVNLLPAYTCTNFRKIENFFSGWETVHTEHSITGIGRFDIALERAKSVRPEGITKKELKIIEDGEKVKNLVGVIEVLHTSEMKEQKVAELNRHRIPWVEAKATPFLEKEWNGKKPLLSFRMSGGDWKCQHCSQLEEKQASLRSIPFIVDIYPPHPTENGYGKMTRRVFARYEDPVMKSWSSLPQTLVVGSYTVTSSRHMSFNETYSVGYHVGLGFPIQDIVREYRRSLRKEFEKGTIFDVRLDYPGIDAKKELFFPSETSTFIDMDKIVAIQQLFPAIERKYRQRYRWDMKEEKWLKEERVRPITDTYDHHMSPHISTQAHFQRTAASPPKKK